MNHTPVTTPAPAGRILVDVDGAIGFIRLANAERHNALTFAMWTALPAAIAELDANEDVRVILIEGADGGAFASGADISEFETVRATAESSRAYEAANAVAFDAIRRSTKPVVAVIRRYCIGGGVGIAAACDIRLTADTAVYAIPAARLGLAYPPEAIADVVALIGPARTRDLFFTGRRIDAATALRIGLVEEVHSEESLGPAALAYARQVAALAPLTHRAVKSAVRLALGSEAKETALALADACFDSDDYREGRAAFLAKKTPVFTGH